MISYAQNFEDVLLNRCFGKLSSPGFYVDIGAYHPVSDSVTKVFYDAGWSGINVEPGPGIAALRRDRPRDINLALAVTDAEGQADFWEHTDGLGTSTLLPEVSGLLAKVAGERIHRQVPTLSLALLLARHASDRHIHFLKIDAEGSEDKIIAGGDWQKFRPEVLVVESTDVLTNRRLTTAWQKVLQDAAYAFAYFDGINDFWVREESADLLKAFALPVNTLDGFEVYHPEIDSLRGALAQEREAAADRLKQQKTEAENALAEARDRLLRVEEGEKAAHRDLATTQQEVVSLRQAYADRQEELVSLRQAYADRQEELVSLRQAYADRQEELVSLRQAYADLQEELVSLRQAYADLQEELVSLRQAYADLQKWRFRLLRKLKIDGAPRELRLVLPLARAARLALPRRGASTPAVENIGSAVSGEIGSAVSGEIGSAVSGKKKRGLRRKLKKQIKSARRSLRRSLISATRAAVVPMVLQLAKRSPKLFAKIRKDVRRHIAGDDQQAASGSATTVPPQVLEDAILTIALRGDKSVPERTS